MPLSSGPLLALDRAPPAIRAVGRSALTTLLVALGLAAVGWLEPWLGRPYYFVAFVAISGAAVAAGTRYGALGAVLFGSGYAYDYLAPRGSFAIANPHELAGLVGFTATGVLVAWIGGSLRRAYARLRAQAIQLERTEEQREDLVRSLAHDLRSPLSVIAMSARVLEQTPGVAPDVVRRATTIGASVRSAAAMLEDLVEVARLESGHVALAREPVDLGRLAADLRERLPGTSDPERVRLELAPGLPVLQADPLRLERVLVNLLSNALKYAPPATPVTVRAARAPSGVVLTVADEGPGIAPDELPNVFRKYFRARGASEKEGLGLGLYISRLLVEAHGGRIWATSTVGHGTTVHVALPVARGSREEASAEATP
ncbi:MAG: ATP-binding protein [Anaeromyxobacteraceae bacterium]